VPQARPVNKDVIIRPEIETGNAVDIISTSRQHQHGHVAYLSNFPQDLNAAHAGHHDIQNDDIG
jgi:hypothetical protein